MAATALRQPDEPRAVARACVGFLERVLGEPALCAAVNDELIHSDPDLQALRAAPPAACVCPDNQPGSREMRHRMLADVRAMLQTAAEELTFGGDGADGSLPRLQRAGRPGTVFPGEGGREVDSALELLPCAAPIALRGHTSPVNALAAWCDLLFSASDDKTVRVWDLASDTCVSVLDLHFLGAVTCLAIGPGHHDVQLYTGSDRCRVFNVSPKVIESGARIECVHTLEHHAAAITSIAVAEWHPPPDSEDPRGWRLYTGSADRTILVYDTVVGPAASLPPCTDAATARCTQKAERPVGRRRRCGGAGGLGPTPESKLIVPDPAAPQRRRFSVGCTSREARRPRAC